MTLREVQVGTNKFNAEMQARLQAETERRQECTRIYTEVSRANKIAARNHSWVALQVQLPTGEQGLMLRATRAYEPAVPSPEIPNKLYEIIIVTKKEILASYAHTHSNKVEAIASLAPNLRPGVLKSTNLLKFAEEPSVLQNVIDRSIGAATPKIVKPTAATLRTIAVATN